MDMALQFNPGTAFPLLAFLAFVLPLIAKSAVVIKAREARLRAALELKRRAEELAASQNDPQLLRARTEAEAAFAARQAEESDAREVRILEGRVLFRVDAPQSVESAKLEEQLQGVVDPVPDGGISPMENIAYLLQIMFLIPAFLLLLTDPTPTLTDPTFDLTR